MHRRAGVELGRLWPLQQERMQMRHRRVRRRPVRRRMSTAIVATTQGAGGFLGLGGTSTISTSSNDVASTTGSTGAGGTSAGTGGSAAAGPVTFPVSSTRRAGERWKTKTAPPSPVLGAHRLVPRLEAGGRSGHLPQRHRRARSQRRRAPRHRSRSPAPNALSTETATSPSSIV